MSGKQPLADRMYEELLAQLMSGARQPGEAINIGALGRELDVSQTPLREALARLEHSGLVQREALRGYFVAPAFTRRELVKLGYAREVLEPAIASESALRRTPEFLEELDETIRDLASSAKTADAESSAFHAYWSADDRFHRLIATQADNPFLETAYASLSGQVQRYRLIMKSGQTHAAEAAEEHRAIRDAIAAGDPAAAAAAMQLHVRSATERTLITQA